MSAQNTLNETLHREFVRRVGAENNDQLFKARKTKANNRKVNLPLTEAIFRKPHRASEDRKKQQRAGIID